MKFISHGVFRNIWIKAKLPKIVMSLMTIDNLMIKWIMTIYVYYDSLVVTIKRFQDRFNFVLNQKIMINQMTYLSNINNIITMTQTTTHPLYILLSNVTNINMYKFRNFVIISLAIILSQHIRKFILKFWRRAIQEQTERNLRIVNIAAWHNQIVQLLNHFCTLRYLAKSMAALFRIKIIYAKIICK